MKRTKIQILTLVFLVFYVIWEINVDRWLTTVLGPIIRIDLIFVYPILIVLISISIYQMEKKSNK
ncbi:hypothetical protein [Anaerovorax sp. IOR16]|uniref:hypothetical protein n=1 Tax=Anaerovorax sp. IOR16 TaxID=2773458 RepID=UPI0019D0DE29|nr:hypothetical protein [Anaerovorax sp. IOR16]